MIRINHLIWGGFYLKSILIRSFFLFFGVFGCWIFFLPFLNRRILNIGNLTGFLVFLFFILYGVFFSNINHSFIFMLKKGGFLRSLILSSFCIFFLLFILFLSLSFQIYQGFSKRPMKNSTAVVLGCKVYGKNPSLMLRERLDAAYSYLIENPDTHCILSGGQGKGEDISEAEAMFVYLTSKGIASDRLFLENLSTNTRENLRFSKKIIEDKGLNPSIAIVTNEFHEYRAGKIAGDLGLEFGAVSGKTAWWLFPTFFVRELYSILYEWVR